MLSLNPGSSVYLASTAINFKHNLAKERKLPALFVFLISESSRSIQAKLVQEKVRLTSDIAAIVMRKDDLQEIIEFGTYYLSNLAKLFADADLSLKRRIIGSTFPEKLLF